MGALLFNALAAVTLVALQMAAVDVFVRRPGSRVRDWLAGVLAPAMIGNAIFEAVRGRPATTTLVAFGVAVVVAHVVTVLAGAVFRAP